MASSLESTLAHITRSAESIQATTFAGPQIFANALLKSHEITTLIRDTEAHERALFTVTQPAPPPRAIDPSGRARRRTVVPEPLPPQHHHHRHAGPDSRLPRRNTAVAAVLGGDLMQRLRGRNSAVGRADGDLDVETLLEGAEKLCRVYPIPGALERIQEMKARYADVAHSVDRLEKQCADQSAQLASLGRQDDILDDGIKVKVEADTDDGDDNNNNNEYSHWTAADIEREEAAIRDLERKKASLESQIRRSQEGWK